MLLNHENRFNPTRKIVSEHPVFQRLLGEMKRPTIKLTSIMPDRLRAEAQMKSKAEEADVEESKGSITEAIGKITANPSTEKKGAAMKKAAQQRNAADIAFDASDEDSKS